MVGSRIAGLEICSSHLLRERSRPLSVLKGAAIQAVRRRGKLLLMDFDNGFSLIFHLKMTGRIQVSEGREEPDKHVHLWFELTCGRRIIFRDVRKFGYCVCRPSESLPRDKAIRSLGPEPLEVKEDRFYSLLEGRKGRIKNLLLNQSFLAGIGNIYADEILFRARIHPLHSAGALSLRKKASLYAFIREVLSEAVDLGGSTIRDYRDSEGRSGDFQIRHRVYGREGKPCLCGRALIRRITVNGRSTHFCPRCQPRRG